jgi:hypothetical protein
MVYHADFKIDNDWVVFFKRAYFCLLSTYLHETARKIKKTVAGMIFTKIIDIIARYHSSIHD